MNEVSTLDEIRSAVGNETFLDALHECLPTWFRLDDDDRETLRQGTIPFVSYLDRNDLEYIEERCVDILASGGLADSVSEWTGKEKADITADDGTSYISATIHDSLEDGWYQYMRPDRLEFAEAVLEKLSPSLLARGYGVALDVDSFLEGLEAEYVFAVDFGVADELERLELPLYLLLIGSNDNDADFHASRHVLPAAHNFIRAQEEGGTLEDGIFCVDEDFVAADGSFTIPEDYKGSAVEELCASQGTSLEDVVNGRCGGRFAKSLRDEILEGSPALDGWPAVCLLATVPFRDAVSLSLCSRTFSQDDGSPRPALDLWVPTGDYEPSIGIYDAANGCGGMFEVALDRPFEVLPENVCYSMPREVSRGGKSRLLWSVDECYGFAGSAYSARLLSSEELSRRAARSKEPAAVAARAAAAAAGTADDGRASDVMQNRR